MPSSPLDEDQIEAMRRRAWMEQGVVMLRPDEVIDDWLRQALVNEAVKRFGKRSAR